MGTFKHHIKTITVGLALGLVACSQGSKVSGDLTGGSTSGSTSSVPLTSPTPLPSSTPISKPSPTPTATPTASPTATPSPSPSPTAGPTVAPFNSVLLDSFENGMRTLGGHNLWDAYTGEGGVGTTSVSSSAAHDGAMGLQEVMTAGRVYMHFYSNNGNQWYFAHQLLESGTWATNTFNRMAFWVKHPANMPTDSGNGHNIELGTYTRCQSCDATTQNSGGDHYYHYYNAVPGVWTYVIVDNHPQHAVGGPTTDPGILTSPTTDGPSWNYFDSLTRWYWDAPYIPPTGYPAPFNFDTVIFYQDTNNEDVAHIASLEASYNPTTNTLHVGFVRNATEDSTSDTTYTARYAFTDIYGLGFSNAVSLGSVGPDGQGDYVNKKIESSSVNLAGKSKVYVAVQKQGNTNFRQIVLDLSRPQ